LEETGMNIVGGKWDEDGGGKGEEYNWRNLV
jgi:hypothetical protein